MACAGLLRPTTDRITHTTAFVTPVVEHWLEQEINQATETHFLKDSLCRVVAADHQVTDAQLVLELRVAGKPLAQFLHRLGGLGTPPWNREEGNVLFNDALNTFYFTVTAGTRTRKSSLQHLVGSNGKPVREKREGRKEMFYLTTHSTHFIYSYMTLDIWLRTILIVRMETRCCHIGNSLWLTARILLYAPSHRQDSTYHGLCYTSRGALAVTKNSSMGPPHEGSIRQPITPWANALTMELHLDPVWVREKTELCQIRYHMLKYNYNISEKAHFRSVNFANLWTAVCLWVSGPLFYTAHRVRPAGRGSLSKYWCISRESRCCDTAQPVRSRSRPFRTEHVDFWDTSSKLRQTFLKQFRTVSVTNNNIKIEKVKKERYFNKTIQYTNNNIKIEKVKKERYFNKTIQYTNNNIKIEKVKKERYFNKTRQINTQMFDKIIFFKYSTRQLKAIETNKFFTYFNRNGSSTKKKYI